MCPLYFILIGQLTHNLQFGADVTSTFVIDDLMSFHDDDIYVFIITAFLQCNAYYMYIHTKVIVYPI